MKGFDSAVVPMTHRLKLTLFVAVGRSVRIVPTATFEAIYFSSSRSHRRRDLDRSRPHKLRGRRRPLLDTIQLVVPARQICWVKAAAPARRQQFRPAPLAS